jgi:hypothetical protein
VGAAKGPLVDLEPMAALFSRRRAMAVRDPVTGRWLPGNGGGRPGRMTQAKAMRLKLADQTVALESTEMPLDHLPRVMRSPAENPSTRFQAAEAAAPYCHPQLQAIAVRNVGSDGKPIAPVVNVIVMQPPEPKPRLTSRGPEERRYLAGGNAVVCDETAMAEKRHQDWKGYVEALKPGLR